MRKMTDTFVLYGTTADGQFVAMPFGTGEQYRCEPINRLFIMAAFLSLGHFVQWAMVQVYDGDTNVYVWAAREAWEQMGHDVIPTPAQVGAKAVHNVDFAPCNAKITGPNYFA